MTHIYRASATKSLLEDRSVKSRHHGTSDSRSPYSQDLEVCRLVVGRPDQGDGSLRKENARVAHETRVGSWENVRDQFPGGIAEIPPTTSSQSDSP